MANTVANMPLASDPDLPKRGKSRKALKQKNSPDNDANVMAAKNISKPSPTTVMPNPDEAEKENHESLSQPKKNKQGASKGKQQKQSLEKELEEMQKKLQQLFLEKEKTDELLKARDEMLKLKEEELESRGKEQEKLQMELKKLQKLKEFKPNMTFPLLQSLRDKEQEKNDNKKKKKKGCPEKKKPSTPYILWCKDQWTEVKKDNPEADFKEMSNILGAKWKNMSQEEKKPYEEKYQAEKEVYLKMVGEEKRENEAMKLLEEEQKQRTAMELLEQYLQFKQEVEKENKKTRKEKDPLKPKQPLSAFFLFSNEKRSTLVAENKNILEVAKITGEEWKKMTEEQKRPYEEMAKINKEKHIQEMGIYKQKKAQEADNLKREEEEQLKIQKVEALQLLKKKEKTQNLIKKTKEKEKQQKKKQKEEKNVDPNKPRKPASSYFLFSKETRKNVMQERPGINNSSLNALVSLKWKELNEQERQIWNEKAAEAKEIYKKELEEYNKNAAAEAIVHKQKP